MKITNRYNLPSEVVRAVTVGDRERTPDARVISVTNLIKPPQMRLLEWQHHDEMVQDASDRFWALFGTALHKIVEMGTDPDDAMAELALSTTVIIECATCGPVEWRVSGRVDHYGLKSSMITDWKTTRASFMWDQVKPEWEQQLNFYAWLMRRSDYVVKHLRIVQFYRDWTDQPHRVEDNYPPRVCTEHDVPLWHRHIAQRAVMERLMMHERALHESPDECTAEERWARSPKFAVIKNGAKRAYRVFDTNAEATALLEPLGEDQGLTGYRIERREGVNVRCEKFCNASPWCKQWEGLRGQTK